MNVSMGKVHRRVLGKSSQPLEDMHTAVPAAGAPRAGQRRAGMPSLLAAFLGCRSLLVAWLLVVVAARAWLGRTASRPP